MLETIMSVFAGGATGLLGSVITRAFDFFQKRQDHKREMELRRLDLEIANVEASGAERVAAVEAESAAEQSTWAALRASFASESRRLSRHGDGWAMVMVDVVRGLIRPILTLGLIALIAVIYFSVGAADLAAAEIRPRIIDTVLYLATAAVLWWFGSRPMSSGRPVFGLPWRK